MKKHFFPLILASIALLFAFQNNAYSKKYPFRTYSVDDGLPSFLVNTILQDRQGYLWFGTTSGACKFDGINFTTYTTEDGLGGNNIWRMTEDKDGNLWFCMPTGEGVSKFDGNVWKTYTTEDGLASNIAYSILEDSKGNLWVGTWGSGVSRFDGENWTTFSTEDGLADNRVRDIFEDSEGNLWFGTQHHGASRFDGKKWINTNLADLHTVNSILEDSNGNIWLGGNGRLREQTERLAVKIAGELKNGDYKYFTKEVELTGASEMIEDSRGNIWFGGGGGLARFDGENWEYYTNENGLPAKPTVSMFEDMEGDLWFGTEAGVARLTGAAFTTFTTSDGLPGNSIAPVLEDAHGNLWFKSEEIDGVTRYDGEKWITYVTKDGLGGSRVYDLFEDSEGNLWFATGYDGLSKFDGKEWTTYTAEDWGGEAGTWIAMIYLEDKEGNLWFSAGNPDRIMRYDGKNWTHYTGEEGFNEVLKLIEDKNGNLWFVTKNGVKKFDGGNWSTYPTPKGTVIDFGWWRSQTFLEDINGNLWFRTRNGLTRFDGESWKTITTENGLAHYFVWSIHQDAIGNLWIGTNGGGISKFDGAEFTNYTTEDGLSSNVCWFIIEHDSYLFFGTPKGLNRFDGKTFKVYTENDGFTATAVTPLKDSKGNLWFVSTDGVIRFDPSFDRPNLAPPPVYITHLKINDRDTTVAGGLKLEYKENNVKIDYVGLCYSSPEDVLYHYKLEGLDKNWHETKEHYISYPFLPPGKYTFEVKARNRDGIWSEKLAELAFVILPPFWTTAWFRGSIAVILLLGLWGISTAKISNIKRRSLELENRVKERTKDLEEERDKSDELLHNILPAEIVKELKEKGITTPRRYEIASILFTDFKGFTEVSSTIPAVKLVEELNEIFHMFDAVIEEYGLEKLKTIGDSYMIGGGLPVETEDHALRCVQAAVKMQQLIEERNKDSGIKWRMRAGIHSGTVVAGVVGRKKFTYDVWGNTVNIASRMESACEEGRVNISAYTYDLVKDIVDCEYRGKVEVKGKGKIDMYFVSQIKETVDSSNKMS